MGAVDRLERLIRPVLADLGFAVVELSLGTNPGRKAIRLRVERCDYSGVTVDDCARISKALFGVLDVEGGFEGGYVLEVSSPGEDRRLSRPADFERFCGDSVKVKLRRPQQGRRNYRGELQGLVGNEVVVQVDGVIHRLPLNDIETVRLCPTRA